MTDQRTTIERETVVPTTPTRADGYGRTVVTEQHVDTGPTGYDLMTRIVVLVFGIIQLAILLRIVLLLIGAQPDNMIVETIMNATAPLVGPFEGIFRTDAVSEGVATLDLAAVAALIGWTILELVILGIVRIARPRTA
jgi:hypothetical protein